MIDYNHVSNNAGITRQILINLTRPKFPIGNELKPVHDQLLGLSDSRTLLRHRLSGTPEYFSHFLAEMNQRKILISRITYYLTAWDPYRLD